MCAPAITLQEALRVAVEASRFLVGVSRDPSRALSMIEPFSELEELTCGSAHQIQLSRSIVCAVVADCHNALGDFHTAANWYRRASGYWQKGGYPASYADLAIRHQLVDHYQTALECMRANRADWQSRPLCSRIYSHIISRWWMYPSQWSLILHERSLIPKLESLIAEWHNR